jgi:nitronate monooxygenase
MAYASGGALAASVSAAGGLGMIGGGYGDASWLEREFAVAGNQRIGCGFITWSLSRNSALLEIALARKPAAVMLSFGDLTTFANQIRQAGAALICQCQTLAHVREALEVRADMIVAQGAEAGGHGQSRATITLTPEVADFLARNSPDTLLLAAGGIADGRGLAAARALGADGVLMGTRFWATKEALVHPRHHAAALAADGDATVRQRATDIARGLDWPDQFTARVLQNDFVREWVGREAELRAVAGSKRDDYLAALAAGDPERSGVHVGECVGLIHDVPTAGEVVEQTVVQGVRVLRDNAARARH